MKHENILFWRWLGLAVLGLVLTGFGLALLGEAIIAKLEQRPWFWPGTGALVVFNAGLSCFGQAVINRVKLLAADRE